MPLVSLKQALDYCTQSLDREYIPATSAFSLVISFSANLQSNNEGNAAYILEQGILKSALYIAVNYELHVAVLWETKVTSKYKLWSGTSRDVSDNRHELSIFAKLDYPMRTV